MAKLAPHLSRRAVAASGQPIAELMHQALARPELISLAAGFVDQASLPVELVQQAFAELTSKRDVAQRALQYGTTAGYTALREQVLQRWLRADGRTGDADTPSVDQVVLTAGSNQLLHVLTDTLCDPGDIVVCAAPTYFVYLGILANLGVRAVGVATDTDGMLPDALEATLQRLEATGELDRVRAIYVVSYFDNPASTTLPADRRAKVVELANRYARQNKIYVIEDAAYRELRFAGDDVPSLQAYDEQGDTVIVTHTFSKSLAPGLRVGFGILPLELVEPVLEQKGNADFGSPNFNQYLLAHLLAGEGWDNHLVRLGEVYRDKCRAMQSAAERYLAPLKSVHWEPPAGGLYMWLRVPDAIDTGLNGPLWQRCLAQGVLYVPGEYCYPAEGEPVARNRIRLTFGVQSPERIEQGIAALGRALQELV